MTILVHMGVVCLHKLAQYLTRSSLQSDEYLGWEGDEVIRALEPLNMAVIGALFYLKHGLN